MTSTFGASLHGGMRFLRSDFYSFAPPDDEVAHMITDKPTRREVLMGFAADMVAIDFMH